MPPLARAARLLAARLRRLVNDDYFEEHKKDALKKGKIWNAKWDAEGSKEINALLKKLHLGKDSAETVRELFQRVRDELGSGQLAKRAVRHYGLDCVVFNVLGMMAAEVGAVSSSDSDSDSDPDADTDTDTVSDSGKKEKGDDSDEEEEEVLDLSDNKTACRSSMQSASRQSAPRQSAPRRCDSSDSSELEDNYDAGPDDIQDLPPQAF